MFVSVLMTHFYDVNELDVIIRRSNKSRLSEDSAQKATGKKNVKRERTRSRHLQTVGHSYSLICPTKSAELGVYLIQSSYESEARRVTHHLRVSSQL